MRKLATAAAVSLALASSGAFGLGLGDIEMTSALNQPMSAEIQLTSVQPGELDELIVQLASADAFERAGIERTAVLTDLQFSVVQSFGEPVIRVVSSRPIVEPFLNFLVEVDWPQGRMVREYTVLLDPPVLLSPSASERNTAADQPALVSGGDSALIVPTPIQRDELALEEGFEVGLGDLEDAAGESVLSLDEATNGELVSLESLEDVPAIDSPVDSIGGGEIVSLSDLGAPNTDALANGLELGGADSTQEINDDFEFDDGSTIVSLDDLEASAPVATTGSASEITVAQGDTLFELAQDNLPNGSTVQQMMLAMLAANESAFINNNINLVRAGAILRVPDSNEVNTLTQGQALAAIGEQNQLWQEYRDNLRAQAGTQVAQNIAPQEEALPEEESSVDTAATLAGLSDEARAILDDARAEVLDREELRIIADNASASTSASATADETTDSNDEARIGEVNRALQLAREELSASRLLAAELGDQVGDLENTTENLDAMVSLRQNEVARLEAQLAEADAAAEAAESAVAEATEAAESAVAEAGDAAESAASDVIADASDAISQAQESAEGAVETVVDSGNNALTEAGETLAEVELFEEDGDTPAQTVDAEAEAEATEEAAVEAGAENPQAWYQTILEDPKRLAIVGVGALGLLGVMGTLLFRRKKRVPEESDFGGFDEAEFHGTDPEVAQAAAAGGASRLDATEEFNAAGAAGVAGVAGAAAVGGIAAGFGDKSDDALDAMDDSFANSIASDAAEFDSPATGQTPVVAGFDGSNADKADALDKDDTISEVDVYLAYGLHGQAEELLTKAVERKPDNEEYAHKLLQTYHAQGNGEAFHATATDFHQRFGGEQNPQWSGIAAMGAELKPAEGLYSSGMSSVTNVATGGSGEFMLDDDDFSSALAGDEGSGSVSREFGGAALGGAAGALGVAAAAATAADDSVDETALMDESLDPAFAFDEADLEATGDFSSISDELNSENSSSEAADSALDNSSLEFPNFDDEGITADDTLDELSETSALDPFSEEALSLDELEGLSDSVDDLTLDIDQLSGDMELDSSELLSSDLMDLEMPDLSSENELTLDSSGALGDSGNDMGTMLDLAKAYIDMGDKDSASSALGEIVKSGSPEQVTEAESLLRNIS